jgi:hypothetical protein
MIALILTAPTPHSEVAITWGNARRFNGQPHNNAATRPITNSRKVIFAVSIATMSTSLET